MWIINVNGTVALVVERASMLGKLELCIDIGLYKQNFLA